MEIAKAIILAGAVGREHPHPAVGTGSPYLFPIANRPLLFHHLESLRRGGLLEATILVDREAHEPTARAVADGGPWDLTIRFGECPAGHGVRQALEACRSFIGEEPVLVQRADTLLRGRLHAHIAAFSKDRLDAMALRLAPHPGRQAADAPPGCLLSPRALNLLMERADPGSDVLSEVRASGGRVREQAVEGCWCAGDVDALLDANRRILQELVADGCATPAEGCELQGPVVIDPSARLRRTTVRGPAVIGPGARCSDSYIGPYTSIGADVAIDGAEIEHSIVLPGAQLAFVGARIESSVIGRHARVARTFTKPSSVRVSIGDGAEVLIS
jgi:glucose-1-phosphate thymidylyltransferase